MTKPPSLRALDEFARQFRAVEQRLTARLEEARARLHHAGNKGSLAESAFREALEQYLPRRVALGHGEVIDSLGHRSAQCDVVAATDAHPNWFGADEASLFLIEGVAAAAEVKAVLTSQHLNSAIEATKAFRALTPDWSGPTEFVANPSDASRYYRSPPFFLFAYEADVSLETVCERVQAASDPGLGRKGESLDGVFVLGRGWVLNFGDGRGGMVSQGPTGERLSGYFWDDQSSPLLMLMRWLPVALAMPSAQIPVLSHYLLHDTRNLAGGA